MVLAVPFNEQHLSCRVLGRDDAPWLVMCHGMALDSDNLLSLAERLAADWRILLWDMPGHGGSPGIADYRVDAMVDALVAAIDSLRVTDPVILGFSFGGIVAQYAVARYPGRFRALIAYGCYAPFHQPAPVSKVLIAVVVTTYRLQSWKRIQHNFARACALTSSGQAEAARAVGRSSKPVFIGMVRALLQSLDKRVDTIFDLPLLYLHGAKDSNARHLEIAARELFAANSQTREVVIANAGHCAHDDRLEPVAEAIRQFLATL
jgi:3-oxoadipate enol-lactonase